MLTVLSINGIQVTHLQGQIKEATTDTKDARSLVVHFKMFLQSGWNFMYADFARALFAVIAVFVGELHETWVPKQMRAAFAKCPEFGIWEGFIKWTEAQMHWQAQYFGLPGYSSIPVTR